MTVEFGSNFITGITTATSDTDVAYKQYADNKPGYALTSTAVPGEFYKGDIDTVTTTVGFSSSFVYDTAGSYNYPIDSSASFLNLFITGSGGGGSESSSDSSQANIGFNWGTVNFCGSEWSYSCRKFASNETIIMDASMNSRQITTSVDGGLSWTKRTIPTSYHTCSLTHANNLFVYASCNNGELITSTDAIHWTMRTASVYCSSNTKFYGVAYGNGLWYASANCCNSAASTDAIHWTLRTVPMANCCGCSNIVSYGNGVWLDFPYGAPRTSTDTIHWTLRTTVDNLIYAFNTRFICGEFFAITRNSSCATPLQRSTDAINWQGAGNLVADRTKLTGSYKFVTDIAKIGFGKKYLVVGDGSELSTSTDFLNWESCKITDNNLWRSCSCSFNYCWYNIHQSNLTDYPNRYFMSGYGYNTTSVSDITLSGVSGNGGAASASYMYDISLENVSKKEGLTLCIGSGGKGGGKSWDVSNCSNWTARTVIANNCHVFDMTFNDAKFVAVGCGKLITTSTDAIHWFRRTIGDVQSATSLTSVIYDYKNWLVTGCGTSNLSYGSLSASTDSIHWTQRTTGMTDDHSSIIYHDKKGTYFLNSKGCSIASSTDSIHWTQRTVGSTNSQFACFIGYGLDYYIASGGQYFSSSTDAIHWKQRTVGNDGGTGNAASNNALAYLHPNYVLSMNVSGNCALISTSTDTINWTTRTGCQQMSWYSGIQTKMNTINGEIYRHNTTNGTTVSSTDTIHWEYKPIPSSSSFGNQFPAFTYGRGQFLKSYSCEGTGFCMSSFDASASSGSNTTISWYDGFPANAKGCVYPLDIKSVGGTPPTSSSASYCFNPVGSGAAVLEYKSSDFRLSSTNTTAAGDFTVEFWYRLKSDAGNPTLQTLFALGEPTENGFLSVKHDATNSALCYYYRNTAGALQSQALATSACNTWYHVALGYDASSTTFSYFLDGTRTGQYNASSSVPAVYGDRLRIGSLYDTYYSLTSLTDQGAFNGEITNFRISNNERYTSGTYTVPTPDFTLDSNTVFLTGRGESLNGSSGSQTCINMPGSSGATTSAPGLSSKYSSGLNQSQYSNIISGLCGKGFGSILTGQSGYCDYRNGLKNVINNACVCSSFSSSGGGAGALADSSNASGGASNKTKFGALSGNCCVSDCSTGVGRGGFGGDALIDSSFGSFSSRTAGSSSCYIRGAAFLNNYYMANNYASTDTITWELRTVPPIWTNSSYAGYMMAYDETNPTEVIMYTGCCQLYHTTDSIHWKMRTTPFGANGATNSCSVNGVNYMDNGEWAVSGCKLISISTDTIHWFLRTAGGCSGGTPEINGVVYGNNKYMAAGHNCQYIATSTDSIAWTLRTRASTNFNGDSNPYTPAFGNGMFVVTAYESISYSTDAISWIGKCVSNTHYIYGIRFSKLKNQFFSAAYYDKIPMSSDGKNWETFCVAGGNCGQGYAAIAINDKMLYSNSCTNWLGTLMIADFQQGSSPGKNGNTGAGGGGGSYIAPIRETQTGGAGGDAYVRINWK